MLGQMMEDYKRTMNEAERHGSMKEVESSKTLGHNKAG